jgi:hypothetical protein
MGKLKLERRFVQHTQLSFIERKSLQPFWILRFFSRSHQAPVVKNKVQGTRTGREKRVDYVGLLKVENAATIGWDSNTIGWDSNSAHPSDMIWFGLNRFAVCSKSNVDA